MESTKRKRDRFLALVVAGTFLVGAAAPARATGNEAVVPGPKPTLSAAASEMVEAMSNDAVAKAAAQGATATQNTGSEGFLKSGKGKATLVLMLAVSGYVLYSKYNDRVKSPIRN